jgi:hypothetical protein
MTFRDDHDAALARADALEDEVERTKRERDELAAKVKELEQAQQKPPKEPKPKKPKKQRASSSSDDSDDKGEKWAAIISVGVTALIAGIFISLSMYRSCEYKKDYAAWLAKSEARKAHRERWEHLVALEPCVRRVAWGTMSVRTQSPEKIDPRVNNHWYSAGSATVSCSRDVAELLGDSTSSPALKAALGPWLDLQRQIERAAKPIDEYYSNRDWVEDNLASAPAMWQAFMPLLDRQVKLTEALRRELPALREEMRAIIKSHEAAHQRDILYWRAALTVARYEINDRAYAAAGIYAGNAPDHAAAVAAIKQPVVQFLELTKQAPIEVRRDLRALDWITSQIVTGADLIGETPLWHLTNTEGDLIARYREDVPGLPPDPGKPPEEPGGD